MHTSKFVSEPSRIDHPKDVGKLNPGQILQMKALILQFLPRLYYSFLVQCESERRNKESELCSKQLTPFFGKILIQLKHLAKER